MNYYKATRPDGTDFCTGKIDYGRALETGDVIRHPAARKRKDEPKTYLSVSISPSDCTGFSWPCRLFRVEPVGRIMSDLSVSPNKRAVSALRVVEELPAWQALGPNGEAVVALIERASRITPDEARSMDAARNAARVAAWEVALDLAWEVAWDAARVAAWNAARNAAWVAALDAARVAAWNAALDAARVAAWNAACGLVVRDLISPEHFDTLYGPWASVMEVAS